MGKVMTNLSLSLDGFVAGPNDDVQQVFAWMMSGDSAIPVQDGRMVLKVSPQSAALIEEALRTTGAMVAGRRMFDIAQAWGGNPPHAPCFIVTHSPPQEWVKQGSPFTFVTDGVESAIRQAKQAAGDKNVAVATASITQQCLKAGLLDEIHVDLAPVLLGEGIRLFEHLGAEPIELQRIRVIEAPGVTHLGFRIVK
jgi:dihydrofolate reductase